MTTIAYKDGVMACDSAWVSNDFIVTYATKIWVTAAGSLFGCAGDGDTRDVERLFSKIKRRSQIPTRKVMDRLDTDGMGLLVLPDRSIWVFSFERSNAPNRSGAWEVRGFDYFAIGSGGLFARACMASGKSAIEAVELTCAFDIMSTLPVDHVGFATSEGDVQHISV